MRKRHTPLSRLLAVTGAGLIVLGIWLEHSQPGLASSLLGNLYIFVPIGVIYASLKAMKPVGPDAPPETKNHVILRYAAAYSRLLAGLIIVGALMIYAKDQALSAPWHAAFVILTGVVFAAAVVLTVVKGRVKA